MSVSQEELMYLQSQLEGLESIFFELMPFGVELKRQQVQDYYDKRFDQATKPVASVAETELRRQFNTKANQVRNLVDSAESMGEAGNKLNLIRAAATLPEERSRQLDAAVQSFCQKLLYEQSADPGALAEILNNQNLTTAEARVLLGTTMFLIVDEVNGIGEPIPVRQLLSQIIARVGKGLLDRNDPFLTEAKCALEAMSEENG